MTCLRAQIDLYRSLITELKPIKPSFRKVFDQNIFNSGGPVSRKTGSTGASNINFVRMARSRSRRVR